MKSLNKMKLKFFKIFVFAFFLNSIVHADSWIQKANLMTTGRSGAISFSILNKGYFGIGENVYTQEFFNDLWEYNSLNNTWTQKSDVSMTKRCCSSVFILNEKAYVCGGKDSSEVGFAECWEYQPLLNIWQRMADMPWGVWASGSFVASDRGYVTGGCSQNSTYHNELFEYNPDSNTWIERSPFPGGGRIFPSTFSIENIGYVCFGTDFGSYFSDVYSYNPIGDSWQTKAALDFTYFRWAATSFNIGNNGYVIGGIGIGGLTNELLKYDPINDSWYNKLNFPAGGRAYPISFVFNDIAYFGLGLDTFQNYMHDLWRYNPDTVTLINNFNLDDFFDVSPNPFSDNLNIKIDRNIPGQISIDIYSYSGQKKYSKQFFAHETNVDLHNFLPGIYFLTLNTKYKMASLKIIKI